MAHDTILRKPGTRKVDFDTLPNRDDMQNRPEGWHRITIERGPDPDTIWFAYWDVDGNELCHDLEPFLPGHGYRFVRGDVE